MKNDYLIPISFLATVTILLIFTHFYFDRKENLLPLTDEDSRIDSQKPLTHDSPDSDDIEALLLLIKNQFSTPDAQPEIVYVSDKYVWFREGHGKDGCNYLSYFNREIERFNTSIITACGGYQFTETQPLYLEYCGSGIINCFDFKNLYAYNLDTGAKLLLISAEEVLSNEETFVHSCYEGNLDQICLAELTIEDGQLTLDIFKRDHLPKHWEGQFDPTQPSEFTNPKAREVSIDLNLFR